MEASQHDEEVRRALVDAYYRRLLDQPEAARRRAQAAYVIASAVAAAVLAAGALGKLEREHEVVQVLGPCVLVAWLVTAGLFLWAVAVPYSAQLPETVKGFSEFQNTILTTSENERSAIDDRQKWARTAALIASALTVVTVVLALALSGTPAASADGTQMETAAEGTMRLRKQARDDLSKICQSKMPAVVQGEIERSTLADGRVELLLPAGDCGVDQATAAFDEEDVTYVLHGKGP